ncbi:PREDICTED: aldose 1-epimerase-like [Nelumbo nucifera]|uniref:Aldose 1-epimerase n=2 Tax=Nelumbo nucifera TaxID=4432 RepID=A0A822XQ16_NELNU|nr:PREDICTED: aldose 1-epimerase-like [Nelumbo nucifera]DAD19558.1 TPA_asm: hypothetical protein HUJ06_021021 [Nelumbo nucifera]
MMARVSLCFVIVAALALLSLSSAEKPEVGFYDLKDGEISLKVTNYGATILSVIFPDKYGEMADVALGFQKIGDYTNDTIYFGGLVGRVANRIAGAQFTLNGHKYKVVANEGNNTLHGGHRGFSDVFWTVRKYKPHGSSPYITLSYRSFDGEQGFPGDLDVSVTYKIVGWNKLAVFMKARALNKATPVNLAQHTYWNLAGHNSGDVLGQHVQIFGSHITPVDKELIPTGKIAPVKGTPYDFREKHTVGCRIDQLPNGYDINYVLDGKPHHFLKKAAMVHDPKSGRMLELWTNAPGLQFYTGNMLKDVKGKDGAIYKVHSGICLETQGFPDSVNHPNFPSQIVTPGKLYKHYMLFKFTTM